jgi:adenylyltransferase/sulfurtransferase
MTQPAEPFKRIGISEAKRLIDEGKIQVIDVRNPDEWQAGHIPQAALVPLPQIINDPETSLKGDRDQPTLFVCGVGERSAVACEVAAMLGFKDVYNLQGGTIAWVKEGNSLAK